MTPEQLDALMFWINQRIIDAVEIAGDEHPASDASRRGLYEAFGFEEGPDNEPVAPGTYPPTSGHIE